MQLLNPFVRNNVMALVTFVYLDHPLPKVRLALPS